MKTVRCLVSGRVQGVFFRASTRTEAQQLGVSGYAKNLEDGRVEVIAHGDAQAVDALVEWLHHGPRHARVDKVEVSDADAPTEGGFRVI